MTVHVFFVPFAAMTLYLRSEVQSPGAPNFGEPSSGVTRAAVDTLKYTTNLFNDTFARSASVKLPLAAGTVKVAVTTASSSLILLDFYKSLSATLN